MTAICRSSPAPTRAPAIERAQRFVEAGADITFVEAPLSIEELGRIAKEIAVPQVANIVHGGRTPDPGHAAFAKMGFAIVLYANAGLQAALHACTEVFSRLKADGSLANVGDRLASFESRQRSVNKDRWDKLESKYRVS
jgi:2-methylisocitrate lyase-like PEP mutase family enzyme